jgi:hypothetical protein
MCQLESLFKYLELGIKGKHMAYPVERKRVSRHVERCEDNKAEYF